MRVVDPIIYPLTARRVWCLAFKSRGQPVDLTGASVELRIVTADGPDLVIPATIEDGRAHIALTPETMPQTPDRYSASVWVIWANGQSQPYLTLTVEVTAHA